jgi:hypothetical protein
MLYLLVWSHDSHALNVPLSVIMLLFNRMIHTF